MAPKAANTGAKRQPGTLNSWLKTSSRNNGQQQRKRPRSSSNVMETTEPAEKKTRPPPYSKLKQPGELLPNSPLKAPPQPKSKPASDKPTISLTERTGDIFSAAPNTLIIHACNCQGSWGGGIALAFKKNYPEAFKVYAKHCRDHEPKSLLGTALLIPPAELNGVASMSGPVGAPRIGGRGLLAPQGKGKIVEEKHFIGCLFTSNWYGKRKDSPTKILSATGPAVLDLLEQVKAWNASHFDGERVGEVRMCKINSGLFAVPWEDSVEVIEGIEVGNSGIQEIEVVEREE